MHSLLLGFKEANIPMDVDLPVALHTQITPHNFVLLLTYGFGISPGYSFISPLLFSFFPHGIRLPGK